MEWRVVGINSEIDYNGPGVYKIQLVDKNGKPLEICRFGGTDEEGVLVIGCSEHIDTRRKEFVTSFNRRAWAFRGDSVVAGEVLLGVGKADIT